ncbi:hypothetical protein P8452_16577 [Trifolium repens]|jgi:hypothetical protein|nr:hypothetical protein P8452_16577 [Trifolium repens]
MKNILALSITIVIVYTFSSQFGIAFSRASTALGTEHLRDSFAFDGIPPDDSAESPAPYHSPPDDSAESPAPAISPCDESTQQYYATKLRYFDLSLYGEEVDRDIDSSYI